MATDLRSPRCSPEVQRRPLLSHLTIVERRPIADAEAEVNVVLVTGGAGFVGRQVVAALETQGKEVWATTHRSAVAGARALEAVDLIEMSSRDLVPRLTAIRPRTLIHCAWMARPGLFWTSPANLDWLAASVRLLKAFAEAGGERVLMVGSCAEYQPPTEGPCLETETPTLPATLYGVTKDALHRTLRTFSCQQGLSWAWARLFHLTGPGESQERLVSGVAQSLVKGTAPQCSAGLQRIDLMDSRDAGYALARLALSSVEGPVNVATGVPRTVRSIVEALAKRVPTAPSPLFGTPLGAPPVDLWADVNRLRHEVGFEPKISFAQMVEQAIQRERLAFACR